MRILKQLAYLKPMVGKKRIFIVAETEKMTEEAANSLLKILEEPPLFSYIILLTNNPFLIIPTIRSRCRILSFSPVSKQDIEKILVERGCDEERARIISLFVHGSLKQALSIDWEEVQAKREEAWEIFFSLLHNANLASFLRNFTFPRRRSVRDELLQIFEILASLFRDLILIKERSRIRLLMNPDYEKEMREMARLATLDQLMDHLGEIDGVVFGLSNNMNVNLLLSSFFSNFKEMEYA